MEKITALEDALEKKSLVGIYSVFYTVAHGDPNFSTGKFRQLLEYVKNKDIENLFQKFDEEDFEPEENWDEDYWAIIASSLIDNFCMERIEHLEQVGKKLYPVKNSMQNDDAIERRRQAHNQVINTAYKTRDAYQSRLIDEEQKKGVKNGHMNKTGRDTKGLIKRILGIK